MTQPGPGLLNSETILAYLRELSAALPPSKQHRIVMVGGAFLALRDLRAATRDIDTIRGSKPIYAPVRPKSQRVTTLSPTG